MLLKCPECKLQVSDKALTCPHCGLPLKTSIKKSPRGKNRKRKRLPNGFGQISEIKGRNLRKRYRAMVSVGKYENGRPIVRMLKPNAYFETYNEAYEALMEYNKSPYELESGIIMSDLFHRWVEEYRKTLKSESSLRTITSAWMYCTPLYKMQVRDVRSRHLKKCIENATVNMKGEIKEASAGTKSRMKSVFNLMLDYAVEYEIVDRNHARTFSLSKEVIVEKEKSTRGHLIFSEEEMNILWDNVNKRKWIDVILIQCYSGWRPQELGLIKIENVDLNRWTFCGGMKTTSGTNRIVPIHTKIRELVKEKYEEAVRLNSLFLINCTDAKTHGDMKLTYDKYSYRFEKVISELNLSKEHRPHDGRKHFISMAKRSNMDEYAIKYIVGHSINDITEKVYTEREISWLCSEMEKLK